MPSGNEPVRIQLSGNVLRVCGELTPDEEETFAKAAQALAETEHKALVIDLSGVEYMGSGSVRDIALVMVRANQHGRSVSIRATKKVVRLLAMGGLDKLATVEVVA